MLTIIQISSKNRFQFTLSVLISVCLWSGVWVAPSAEAFTSPPPPPRVQNLDFDVVSNSQLKVFWDKQENIAIYTLYISSKNYPKKLEFEWMKLNSHTIDFSNWSSPDGMGWEYTEPPILIGVKGCSFGRIVPLNCSELAALKITDIHFYRKPEFSLTSENGAVRWPGSSYTVQWGYGVYSFFKKMAKVELQIINPDGEVAYVEDKNLDLKKKQYTFQIDKNAALGKWKVQGRLGANQYSIPGLSTKWDVNSFFVMESELDTKKRLKAKGVNNTYNWIDEDKKCVRDEVTKLVWEATDRAETFRWGGKTARDKNKQRGYREWDPVIEEANQIELCGYNDWRVPTASELYGLIKIGDYESNDDKHRFINQYIFKDTGITYWTATRSVNEHENSAWVVDFKTGESVLEPLYQSHRVRLVCDLPCQSSKDKD